MPGAGWEPGAPVLNTRENTGLPLASENGVMAKVAPGVAATVAALTRGLAVDGSALAVGYTWLIVYGLRTRWVGAIGTTALELYVRPLTLVTGFAGSWLAEMLLTRGACTVAGLARSPHWPLSCSHLADRVRRTWTLGAAIERKS